MFKRISLGSKIGLGFALLIAIAVALGGYAVWNNLGIKNEVTILAKEFVPEVGIANNLERHALLTMYNMRGYALSEDAKYQALGKEGLAMVNKCLAEAKELGKNSEHLTKLDGALETIESQVKEYEKMAQETGTRISTMAENRRRLNEAARVYTDACDKFFQDQRTLLEKAVASEAGAVAGAGAQAVGGNAGAAEQASPAAGDDHKMSERLKKLMLANEINDIGYETRIAVWKAQAQNDPKLMEGNIKNFDQMDKLFNSLKSITRIQEHLRMIDAAMGAANDYRTAMGELLANWNALMELGLKRQAVADKVLEQSQALAKAGMDNTTEIANASVAMLKLSSTTMIVGLIVAVVISILLSLFISHNITRNFKEIFKGLKSFSSLELEATSRRFKEVIDGMTRGGEQVASASNQVAQGSQQMAEGASEQASSLEEVSSSLEEMASMTQQNAGNSREANQMAREALGAVEKSREAMVRMSQAIGQIKSSSDQTAKIIKTIDEIAFQTNLLALNAAVEAARAGEAGKGFAVVAEEVRNLAQRSAEAAKNTASLIEESQKNSENGVAATDQVEQILKQIGGGVEKLSHLIAEVSSASEEQSKGIEQINTAVAQMDKLTQASAANAEESASASEEMSGQARELNVMVGELVNILEGDRGRAGRYDNHSQPAPAPARPGAGGSLPAGLQKPVKHAPHAPVHHDLGHRNGNGNGNGKAHRNGAEARHTLAMAGSRPLSPNQVIPLDDHELSDF